MTDTPIPESAPVSEPPVSERIAKVIARSGVASRRDAEKMILDGRVSVNGKKITSPALDVKPSDKVAIDGKPIDAPQETRVWLYYKPLGLVTTEKDEQGRRTIFDEMPEGMPRVLNVGRLDLNSEGLLLLTNDGGLKRRLELPETGWLRKYRVRVNGRPMDDTFRPLREGITIDGEDFQPMEVSLDRQQGANAWLTVGIREGKNREIRRAMAAVNLTVNRLIRVSYGPFRLNDMQPGAVVEVKRKLLRDQLGDRLLTGAEDGRPSRAERMAPKPPRARRDDEGERPARRGPPREGAERGERKGFGRQRDYAEGDAGPRKPSFDKEGGAPRSEGFKPRRSDDGEGKRPYAKRPYDKADGEKRPYSPRPPRDGDEGRPGGFSKSPRSFGAKSHRDESTEGKRPYTRRDESEGRKPRAEGFADRKPRGEGFEGKKPYARRDGEGFGEKKPYQRRDGDSAEGRKPYARRDGEGFGEKKPYQRRDGDSAEGRKPYARRDGEGFGEKKPYQRRDGDSAEGRRPYARRDGEGFGEKKPYQHRDGDSAEGRKPYVRRDGEGFGEKKPYQRRDGDSAEGRKPYARRDGEGFGEKKPYQRRDGDSAEGRKPYARRDGEGFGEKKPYQRRDAEGGKPGFKSTGFKSHGGKPGAKPRAEGFKSHAGKASTSVKRPPRGEGKPGPRRG